MTNENQDREGKRKNGLKILESPLHIGLSNSYLIEKSNHSDEIKQAVHDTIYLPALKESGALMGNLMMESREDNQRYTGNFSEMQLIKYSLAVRQEALSDVQVQDLVGLIGSNKEVRPEYDSVYMGDLFQNNEEVAKEVLGKYQGCSVANTVNKVTSTLEDAHKKGLEELVCKPVNVKPLKRNYESMSNAA